MKNKLWSLLALSTLLSTSISVMAEPIEKKKVQVMRAIAAQDTFRPHQSAFPKPIRQNLINHISQSLDHKKPITLFGEHKNWQSLNKVNSLTEAGIQVVKLSLSTQQYTKGTLKLEGIETATLYLNGSEVSGSDSSFDLSLYNGEHRILIVTEQVDNWKKVAVDWQSDDEAHKVVFHQQEPKFRLNAKQMYDSQTVTKVNISPDGKQMLWTKRVYADLTDDSGVYTTELVDVKSQKVVYRWQAMTPRSVDWSNDNRYLSYSASDNLYLLDRHNLKLTTIASELTGAYGFDWIDEQTLIFNWNRTDESGHEITKRYRALEDRWSGWRNNSQIYLLDIKSGFIKQLTDGKLSQYVLDVDIDNHRALVYRAPIDYKAPPHSLTELVELDLKTQTEKVLGQYRTLNNAIYRSNHSKKGFYVLAGPGFVKNQGSALAKGVTPNNYDGQLYFISEQGKVTPLSKDFNPAINSFKLLADGNLLLSTTDQDRTQLYTYNTKRNKFSRIDSKLDVIDSFSASNQSTPTVVYTGTNATSPQKVYIKYGKKKSKLLIDSAKTHYANTVFPTIKDWDYKTESGNIIDGRYYLPANFDKSKKYPTIVYYYGGTSPVGRSFTGRWPFSLWAAQGYVVYVLQPSGAIGYGQEFSAKHVNAWGIETADDIMASTKAFVAEHSFVDGSKLANMGASYGGFMTMYLATKTDMFAASVSHAGISNLAEYWGYGWWGVGYSGVATAGSFPWNNSKFYTEQSPLFQADKITTPLLLIHGDSDTNVPVTESHQMYSALMLQDKDVELIEFLGDDHHINGRSHRMRWWETIMSYLDYKLKEQPLWWETLYPKP